MLDIFLTWKTFLIIFWVNAYFVYLLLNDSYICSFSFSFKKCSNCNWIGKGMFLGPLCKYYTIAICIFFIFRWLKGKNATQLNQLIMYDDDLNDSVAFSFYFCSALDFSVGDKVQFYSMKAALKGKGKTFKRKERLFLLCWARHKSWVVFYVFLLFDNDHIGRVPSNSCVYNLSGKLKRSIRSFFASSR